MNLWTKADADESGFVDSAEAAKFLDAIKEGRLSHAEVTKACKDGVFASVKSGLLAFTAQEWTLKCGRIRGKKGVALI